MSNTERGRRISLPREPIPQDLLEEILPLSEEIKQRLPMTPDHTEGARIDCIYEFLENDLLPRMRSEEPLTVSELAQMAIHRKTSSRDKHPKDLVGEFALLQASKATLFSLKIYYDNRKRARGEWPEEAELVTKAGNNLNQLFDRHLDDLKDI